MALDWTSAQKSVVQQLEDIIDKDRQKAGRKWRIEHIPNVEVYTSFNTCDIAQMFLFAQAMTGRRKDWRKALPAIRQWHTKNILSITWSTNVSELYKLCGIVARGEQISTDG
jgi:hypothetical protein